MMKRLTCLLISVVLFFNSPCVMVEAKGYTANEDGHFMQIQAHAYIDDTKIVKTLEKMKDTYEASYDRMLQFAEEPLKSQLEEQRDVIIELYDQKIKSLENAATNSRRNRGLRGFFRKVRSVGRAFKQAIGWTGKTLGKGIKATIKTVIEFIPKTPEELIAFVIEHSVGGFSIKRLLKKIARKSFMREVEQQIFIKIMEVTKNIEVLENFVELNKMTGGKLKIDNNFLERYKEFLNNRAADEDEDEEEDIDDEFLLVDDDIGEGGYDDDGDNIEIEDQVEITALEELNFAIYDYDVVMITVVGNYTLTNINIRVPDVPYLQAYINHVGLEHSLESYIETDEYYIAGRLALSEPYIDVPREMDGFLIIGLTDEYEQGVLGVYMSLLPCYHDEMLDLGDALYVYGGRDTVILNESIEGEFDIPPEFDWQPSERHVAYESGVVIDEMGYLHIQGSASLLNLFDTMSLEYEGHDPSMTQHMVDVYYDYDIVSVEPLMEGVEAFNLED